MTDPDLLRRITVNPNVFGGKPTVRGMRISVELILSLLAQGETPQAVVDDYPGLELDDIRACIAYAHAVIANDSLDAVRLTGSWNSSSTAALVGVLRSGFARRFTTRSRHRRWEPIQVTWLSCN